MEELKFSVDSALLSELGEKLVETVHVALVELIKNSYDADATTVSVSIIPSKNHKSGPEIQIVDNGLGMSLSDVKKYWMRIATTNKAVNAQSKLYGRMKTGSKGIGRFACRRLGDDLKLITIAKNSAGAFEKTEVEFKWNDFKPQTEVTDIPCAVKTETIRAAKTGTTLVISNAKRDEWKLGGYSYLKRQVALLVANRGKKQHGYTEDPGFNITLTAPSLEKTPEIRDLREDLIAAGWGTLEGSIDSTGHGKYTLAALGIDKKSKVSAEAFPNLKGVSFKIGIFPTKPKEDFRNPRLLSKYNLEKILPEWGGVQVRHNGFRVYPYGEDDWLEIDKDRSRSLGKPRNELFVFAQKLEGINPARSLLAMLSMRNYVGSVEIDSRATGFEMKASREGFVRTDSFEELKRFVRYGIEWAAIYRYYHTAQRVKEESDKAIQALEQTANSSIDSQEVVESAVDFIKQEVDTITTLVPKEKRQEIKKTFLSATNAILKHDATNKQELHHLRLIASTSTLLLIFSHEVKSLIGRLGADSGELEIIESKLSGPDAKIIRNMRQELEETKERFAGLLKMTSVIGAEGKNTPPQRLSLIDRVENAKKCFRTIITDYDIAINIDVPVTAIVGPILEAELYAVILNTLSNAIKSVIAAGGNGEISITASRANNKTLLRILDTGLGIKKEHFSDVFIPFVADPSGQLYPKLKQRLNPEDKYIVGTGSGLGLSIVKEILDVRKGTIRFCEPTGKWKAILEVELP